MVQEIKRKKCRFKKNVCSLILHFFQKYEFPFSIISIHPEEPVEQILWQQILLVFFSLKESLFFLFWVVGLDFFYWVVIYVYWTSSIWSIQIVLAGSKLPPLCWATAETLVLVDYLMSGLPYRHLLVYSPARELTVYMPTWRTLLWFFNPVSPFIF